MRSLESSAISSGLASGRTLMERAGEGCVSALFEAYPAFAKSPQRAVILCGPGNNGGDGFVIARHLHAFDWTLDVLAMASSENMMGDARANRLRWDDLGETRPYTREEMERIAEGARARDDLVVIDALYGIGQRAPLDEALAPVNRFVSRIFTGGGTMVPTFVSVDVPTGLDADTGEALAKKPFPADLVVTFHARKPVHEMPVLNRARVSVVDIGLGRAAGPLILR